MFNDPGALEASALLPQCFTLCIVCKMSGSSNVEAPSARQTHYSSSKAHFMNGQTKQHSSGLSKKALEESDLSDLASVRSRPKRYVCV